MPDKPGDKTDKTKAKPEKKSESSPLSVVFDFFKFVVNAILPSKARRAKDPLWRLVEIFLAVAMIVVIAVTVIMVVYFAVITPAMAHADSAQQKQQAHTLTPGSLTGLVVLLLVVFALILGAMWFLVTLSSKVQPLDISQDLQKNIIPDNGAAAAVVEKAESAAVTRITLVVCILLALAAIATPVFAFVDLALNKGQVLSTVLGEESVPAKNSGDEKVQSTTAPAGKTPFQELSPEVREATRKCFLDSPASSMDNVDASVQRLVECARLSGPQAVALRPAYDRKLAALTEAGRVPLAPAPTDSVTCAIADVSGFPPRVRKHNKSKISSFNAPSGYRFVVSATERPHFTSTSSVHGDFDKTLAMSKEDTEASGRISCSGRGLTEGRAWQEIALTARIEPIPTSQQKQAVLFESLDELRNSPLAPQPSRPPR
ncbi:MAG TPA: hypothetical protein VG942_18790 [Hyphomonadaceae bacterium]|nr:hypothetical protein [Hyphomonadaceae bacterium]